MDRCFRIHGFRADFKASSQPRKFANYAQGGEDDQQHFDMINATFTKK